MSSVILSDNGVSSGSAGIKTSADSSGQLQLQTTTSGGVATTAISIDNNQAVTIQGLTVGKGAGAVSTNTAVGASALAANTTGDLSTAVGYQAATANTTGRITAVGYQAGLSSTTYAGVTLIGRYAGKSSVANDNTAVGDTALYSTTSGASNTAVGSNALFSNTTASNNTAVGYQAGYANTTGQYNVFIGRQAGYAVTTAQGNTFVGDNAGGSVTTGYANTFIGPNWSAGGPSGGSVTTGSKNTIIGAYNGNQGGLDIRTASNYIVLSDGDGNPRSYFGIGPNTASYAYWYQTNGMAISSDLGLYNQIWLKNTGGSGAASYFQYFVNSAGTQAGAIIHNGSTTVSYSTSSDYRLKENVAPMTGALSKVLQLNPVTYTWKEDGTSGQGFIAHELQAIVPECVNGEKDAVDEEGNPQYQGIDTSFLVATLTAAIKELNAKVEAQAAEIAALKGQA